VIRFALAAAALALAACSPPAPKTEAPQSPAASAPVVAADAATQTRLQAAIAQKLGAYLGSPVSLEVETMQTQGDWAWAVVTPRAPDGKPFDFSKTKYADAELDGGGRTYLLLAKSGDTWSVRDFAVGPTDVAWLTWPQKHNAPPQVMGLQ
jgi:hypothetical protein